MTWDFNIKGKILNSHGQSKRAFFVIFSSLEEKIATKCLALRWLRKGEVKTASLLFFSHGVPYQKKVKDEFINEQRKMSQHVNTKKTQNFQVEKRKTDQKKSN